jgi:hypothetical protein
MAQDTIPFVPNQSSGIDVLVGGSPAAMNVIVDAGGAVQRRPGFTTYARGGGQVSAKPIIALRQTAGQGLYAVAGDVPGAYEVYELVDGGALRLSDEGHAFSGTFRPVIAETEAMIVIASGVEVRKVEFAGLVDTVELLGGSPPRGTHIISQNSRLLINDTPIGDKTKINYSAPSQGTATVGHEQWGDQLTAIGRSGFFTAEGRIDPVVAIAESSNEVFAFGSSSLEMFITDSNLIYTPVSLIEYGCATPYGIIKSESSFSWMDEKRRIVTSDGRTAQVISEQIQQSLQDLVRVDDCFGYRVTLGPVDALVWSFPTDGRTFAYQLGGGWSTWMGYSDVLNNWIPLTISSHTFVGGVNENVVGTAGGVVGQLRMDAETDLGERIVAHIDTGFLNRGTDNRKLCRSVKLGLRRGSSSAATNAPNATLQYRDDEGAWRHALEIDLGRSGDRRIVVEARSLGVYRRRQWRFNFAGTTDLVLAQVTEEFDILKN